MLVCFVNDVLDVRNCLEEGIFILFYFPTGLSPSSCCDGLVLPTLLPEHNFPRLVWRVLLQGGGTDEVGGGFSRESSYRSTQEGALLECRDTLNICLVNVIPC